MPAEIIKAAVSYRLCKNIQGRLTRFGSETFILPQALDGTEADDFACATLDEGCEVIEVSRRLRFTSGSFTNEAFERFYLAVRVHK